MRAAACLALASLVACASLDKKSDAGRFEALAGNPARLPRGNAADAHARVSITFAADVDLAATAIERRATDSTVQRNALLWRIRAIPEMRKACFRMAPVGALVDAWIFARQMDQLFSNGAGAGAFGAFQPEAVEVSRRLVQQMRAIGGSIAVSPESTAEFEHKFIDPWVTEHPLSDITFVRESPMGRFADQSPASGDILESVGTMEELAVSLSQQARIYLADLPRQIRGEVDLLRFDMLSPESVASMQSDLHVTAAAADRIASSAEGISSLVPTERQIILDELSRQRNLVMDAVSIERERATNAITRALAADLTELLRNLESQRLATLEWATAERREAIADVRRELAGSMEAVRGERAVVVNDLRHIVDMVLLRVALFLVAAVALAPVVAHAYARIWPRRWREPRA